MIIQKVMPLLVTFSVLTRRGNNYFQGQNLSKFVQLICYDVVFVKGYKMSASLLKLDTHIKSYEFYKILENPIFAVF